MKMQRCRFMRGRDDEWEIGVANVETFDRSEVNWFLDQNGDKIVGVWDYYLETGFGAYLTTE